MEIGSRRAAKCCRVVLTNNKAYYVLIFQIYPSDANMPEVTDSSKLNQTECPSNPHQAIHICDECRTPFSRPILATILGSNQRQTYYACPRCLTKVDTEESQNEGLEQHTNPTLESGNVTPETSKNEKCQHFFGYLNKRQKGNPYPEECLTCPSMVDCLFH